MKELKDKVVENENVENIENVDNVEKAENIEETVKEVKKEEEIKSENKFNIVKEEPKKKHNKLLVVLITVILIAIFLLAFSTVFALANANNKTIMQGITIKGVDVSGLTKEQAYEKLNLISNKKIQDDFDLVYEDSKTTVIPEQFDAYFDIESSINTAYNRGKSGNLIKDNYDILSSMLFKVDINPSFSYNEEFIDNLLLEIQDSFQNKLVEPSYYIDKENLIITKGIDGITIDSNALKLKLISNINNFSDENKNIVIPVVNSKASNINIEKIYSEVKQEPQDAYFTKDPFTVHPHVVGVDFAISMDEAKEILKEDKESYTIPLKITNPSVTTSQIGSEAFPNLLGKYSTTYSTKNVNRSTNIKLAASKINGTVVMPGQTFSYNSTVGQRTTAAGFKEAAVYAGGEVTTGIGGGICQVSSTLYNSVLLSNLKIVERHNHGFNPGYVAAGRDATVSWGGPDFKFKNDRNFPIKIVASGSGGTIVVEIYGVKEDNDYDVEIQSYVTGYIQYKTINKEDSSLGEGQTKVLEKGSNGCKSVCYRILKKDGNVVSKTLLSSDTYSPHNRIVLVGTSAATVTNTEPTQTTNEQTPDEPIVTPTPTSVPTPTPTPTPTTTPTPIPTPVPTQTSSSNENTNP